MNVEYLVLIDSSELYCQSVESLNSSIQGYDQIKVGGTELKFSGCKFKYDVAFRNVEGGNQRYFHIKLGLDRDSDEQKFRDLLKLLRTILTKISGRPPEILWDEMGSRLCERAYPKLHRTENLLRKLITKFMLLNVGVAWTKEAIPSEVEESIKTKRSDRSANYLHDLDFIQLSNLLFKEYFTGDVRKITEKISASTTTADLDINELKELVPASNWQRYFAPIIECDSGYLKKRWERLYELRCKVAHNRFITVDELKEINVLTDELDEKFDKAISSLAQVEVSAAQKEEVAENVAATSNGLFAEFLKTWEILLSSLRELGEFSAADREEVRKLAKHNWEGLTSFALRKKYINEEFKERVAEIAQFRNAIVHNPDVSLATVSILARITMMERLAEELWETAEGTRIGLARMREAM
ncbi:HEPN domain-containing protein [Massilia agilis]|uniref:HEPN domain-containing protein n=1 Tax=Massilia agilis TaxID=1811226 RepID=A0ABT2D9X8_9BURK|nr:HEPN domain-containing protein [Massilia agilis]MCS0808110.1 HEPN domain-containing protein [Massilia agilis]